MGMHTCVRVHLFGCSGLNENVLHRLRCFNTWSPVGGAVCEGSGGVALLEEVHHPGQASRV